MNRSLQHVNAPYCSRAKYCKLCLVDEEDTDAEAEELLTGNKHLKPEARQNFRPPVAPATPEQRLRVS